MMYQVQSNIIYLIAVMEDASITYSTNPLYWVNYPLLSNGVVRSVVYGCAHFIEHELPTCIRRLGSCLCNSDPYELTSVNYMVQSCMNENILVMCLIHFSCYCSDMVAMLRWFQHFRH